MLGLLEKLGKPFHKGGKLEKLYPAYEALDTFLYTPPDVTTGKGHVRDGLDLKRMMIVVVWALVPCVLMAMYNTGLQANEAIRASEALTGAAGWRGSILEGLGVGYDPGSIFACFVHGALYFLPVYVITMAVGGTWEAIFALVRGHEINEGFLVTGLLFPLTLPPTIPLWQVAVGISFGVVLAKEVFGGTGKNFLNVALASRAFLYFAYPADISGEIWVAGAGADGVSGATILGVAASNGMEAVQAKFTLMNTFLGFIPGSMGETSVLACLLGACFLILTGIGSWRIMLGVVIGTVGLSGLLHYAIGSQSNPMFGMSPIWHLCSGGLAFGLVFMATDPVSAAMTETGKWFYGMLIGFMTVLIRVINPAFPEGIMLAILFGNVFAPLIDYFVVKANVKRRMVRSAQG
ncbi:MAG: NADH:ubiquinone reductase (Na(+)-transporting) subunit B [Planctomycetes bacterium]|nr:NADH:ubiquinone reductase (Na(+)-transporting) subunit B [Planctomycetota bacterium]